MCENLSLLILITWLEHSKLDTKGAWPIVSDPVNAVIVVVTNTGSGDWRINHSRDPERGRNSSPQWLPTLLNSQQLSSSPGQSGSYQRSFTSCHKRILCIIFFILKNCVQFPHFCQWHYIIQDWLKDLLGKFLIISLVFSKISGSRFHFTKVNKSMGETVKWMPQETLTFKIYDQVSLVDQGLFFQDWD